MKTCSKCAAIKEDNEFYSGKCQCITCVLEIRKNARAAWSPEQKKKAVVATLAWRKKKRDMERKRKKAKK